MGSRAIHTDRPLIDCSTRQQRPAPRACAMCTACVTEGRASGGLRFYRGQHYKIAVNAQRFRWKVALTARSCPRRCPPPVKLRAADREQGGATASEEAGPASSDLPSSSLKEADSRAPPDEPAFDAWFTASTMLQLWAIMLGLGYAGVPLLSKLLAGDSSGSEGAGSLGQAAALFVVEATVLLAVRGLLQRRLASAEAGQWVPRLEYRWDAPSVLIGLGAGAAALAVNNAMLVVLGQGLGEQPEATGEVAAILHSHDALAALLLFLGSAVLAPAAEEAAYRGFLLPSLQRVLPAPAAVAAVAALFAAAHLQAEGLVQLTVVGGCLGAAAVVSRGNLAAPTAGHVLYNSALFLSLLLASSSD